MTYLRRLLDRLFPKPENHDTLTAMLTEWDLRRIERDLAEMKHREQYEKECG
mgnify:FL=1